MSRSEARVRVLAHRSGILVAMGTDLQRRLEALRQSGDLRTAATEAIEAYGPEVLGWLFVTSRNRARAEDAFLAACEDLWRSLPAFRGECSLRTWMYMLARRALHDQRERAAEREDRNRPLSEASAIVDRVRSATAPWQRTDVKERFASLRDELSEEDRSLLVLRIDKALAWEEIALVLGEQGEPKKVSAKLRKRFQGIKEHLRQRAQETGILDE
jgi:RNA polymerase sigma-70 factor, ECF subfamily